MPFAELTAAAVGALTLDGVPISRVSLVQRASSRTLTITPRREERAWDTHGEMQRKSKSFNINIVKLT